MLIPTLEKLISFKTLSKDKKESQNALDWVQSELRGLPLYQERHSINGFPALIATTQDTRSPRLWLQAHIDVVTGSDELFGLKYKDNRAYGRGVYDMKFAIACYVELLKELKSDLPEHSLGLMITSDEEVGGFHGTKMLLEKGYGGDAVILPDGGFNWCFEKAAKGALQLMVRSYGSSAHSSRPWEGENAIQYLAVFLHNLKKEFPEEPCVDEKHLHNTLSVTRVSGGENNNKIPNYAEALVDMRFMPDLDKEGVYSIVEKAKKGLPGINFEEYFFADSFKNDLENGYYASFSKSAKDIFGIDTDTCLSHGSSDARYFAAKGVVPMVIAPQGGGHHGEHEWIDVEDMERFYHVLKDFIKKECR